MDAYLKKTGHYQLALRIKKYIKDYDWACLDSKMTGIT